MLPLTYLSPSTSGGATQSGVPEAQPPVPAPIVPAPTETAPTLGRVAPPESGDDSHLRHLIIGSPADVQEAIARLHVLQYVERHRWTPLISIGAQGIHITPAQGQVLSYLVLQGPLQ